MSTTQTDDAQAACAGSLLVSIPKSGTHMTLKLYGRAGYVHIGWGEIEPSAQKIPRDELKREILQSPAVAAIADRFWFLKPDVLFAMLAHHARTEIGDTPATMSLIDDFPDPAVQGAWREIRKLKDRSLFVPRLVASTHLFPWSGASYRFLTAWGTTGSPSIVYGYRDPRAQIVSMVRFLASSEMVSRHPFAQVYRPILQGLGSMDRMLSFAISDAAFPFREVYRQNRWMLFHPNVLKLRFEDLVGEEGGGSRESQREAVENWARFLAVGVPPETLTENLFGATKTFRKGTVDSWRDVFKPHHLKQFEREFGDVLEDYGYAETGTRSGSARRGTLAAAGG
jgi:hypothetical protein